MKESIILTGNCFWCLEAVFQKIKGVENVESGYYSLRNYEFKFSPDDKLEAVQISYFSDIIPLSIILDIFYSSHTPTINSWTKEKCFAYQCRSSIVCFNQEQYALAEQKVKEVIDSKLFDGEVETKLIKKIDGAFTLAKKEDQNFYIQNPKDGYCTSIINPKLDKVSANFSSYFKK